MNVDPIAPQSRRRELIPRRRCHAMPDIDTQGRFTLRLKPDRKLHLDVHSPHDFFGEVINRQHIGKSGDQLVALWNAEHPGDPLE